MSLDKQLIEKIEEAKLLAKILQHSIHIVFAIEDQQYYTMINNYTELLKAQIAGGRIKYITTAHPSGLIQEEEI